MSETNRKVLSLPEVARASGANLDVLRKNVQAAAAQGLVFKVGSNWACESANANAVRVACEQAALAKKVRK